MLAVFVGFRLSVPVIKFHDKSSTMGDRYILAHSFGGAVHHGGKVTAARVCGR